jgi:hypothetical protein
LYRRKSHLRGRYNRPWRFHRSISRAVTGRRNRDLACRTDSSSSARSIWTGPPVALRNVAMISLFRLR